MHPEVRNAIDWLRAEQARQGWDPFGFDPDALERILPAVHALYRSYFRVLTFGIENIPHGRALLIANHSGQIPLDGMMIATSLLVESDPPRLVRAMIEKWVPTIPFISSLFARVGQVVGTPNNARSLLHRDDLLMVFPEGSRGISKTFDRRYQLEEFGLGFMRLALETNTPIVPIAVVGAEEQLPSFYNARRLAKVLRMPALPISPTLFVPLPVRYRIYFGEPMYFTGHCDDEDRVIREKVDQVVNAVRALIDRGLRERPGIFA